MNGGPDPGMANGSRHRNDRVFGGGLQCALRNSGPPSMTAYTLLLLLLAPVLVWRVYKRVQKAMASQRSIMSRHYTGLGVFTAMILVGVSETVQRPVIL